MRLPFCVVSAGGPKDLIAEFIVFVHFIVCILLEKMKAANSGPVDPKPAAVIRESAFTRGIVCLICFKSDRLAISI